MRPEPHSGTDAPTAGRTPRGTVRSAAIQAARASIVEAGGPSFSLREIAERVGVVHSALYRHFPGRADLLASVGEDGFIELLGSLERARGDGDSTPVAQLKRFCRAHLEFATGNGALYKVMFGPEMVPFDIEGTSFHKAASAVLEFAMAAVAACQHAADLDGNDPMVPGLIFWAMLHGVAMLAIDGRLDPKLSDERTTSDLQDRAIDALLRGL